jgi:hypothetical protein
LDPLVYWARGVLAALWTGLAMRARGFMRVEPAEHGGDRNRRVALSVPGPSQRNESGARIKWKFTTQKARDKLARAYPDTTKSHNHCGGTSGLLSDI